MREGGRAFGYEHAQLKTTIEFQPMPTNGSLFFCLLNVHTFPNLIEGIPKK